MAASSSPMRCCNLDHVETFDMSWARWGPDEEESYIAKCADAARMAMTTGFSTFAETKSVNWHHCVFCIVHVCSMICIVCILCVAATSSTFEI